MQEYALRQLSALEIPEAFKKNVGIQGSDSSSPEWFLPSLTFRMLKFNPCLHSGT